MNPLGCRVGLTLKQDVKIPHPGLCQNYTSGGCQNPPFWGVKITHPGGEKPGVAGGVKITPKNPSLSMRAGGVFRGGVGVSKSHLRILPKSHILTVKIPPPRVDLALGQDSVKTDLRRSGETSRQETNLGKK